MRWKMVIFSPWLSEVALKSTENMHLTLAHECGGGGETPSPAAEEEGDEEGSSSSSLTGISNAGH